MYEFVRSPYETNRLAEFGLGKAPTFLQIMGYWGNKTLRRTTKGFNNKRPSGSGLWVWFPTQQQALNYAGGALPPPITTKPPTPPVVITPPPPGKPAVPPPVIVTPPVSGDNSKAQYRIEGKLAIALNDLARQKPPDQKLTNDAYYQWTKQIVTGNWLWSYVPPPDAVVPIVTPYTPGSPTIAPANPIVKWYNNATGEIKEARLLNPPNNSGSWILGSTAVMQGLISSGALYGVYAPGGGVTAPVTGGGGMPAYDVDPGANVLPEKAGFSLPTWAWLGLGAAALFFFMKRKG